MKMIYDNIRILIIDDDEDDFLITGDYIRNIPGASFTIEWCFRYQDALKHMQERNYDLYFIDYRLGAKSGVDLLKEALENNVAEPMILLTGKGNYTVDIEAMQLGAVDYLIKTELSTEKLERSIRYALERAVSTKALKANERKYRNIFERSKDMVFITDPMFNVRDVNEAAAVMFGYTREEMLHMNLCDLIPQTQHKKFLQQTLQSRKEINDWEVMMLTKTGEMRYSVLTATAEEDLSHKPYIQGIIHDITNIKKAEKATLQAEKLAAAGRLVRTLAHEVRNPLNNITLSVEQLLQEQMDENASFYLEIIQRNSKRISGLISELLNSSRPSEINLERCNLQSIVDEVIAAAIDRLTLKRIKLQVSYPDEVIYLMADNEKLKLALQNIVINAIEAMEEETGNLSIALHLHEDGVVLLISDNGCGISEENISRLFEPYFTQKRNGMGLGLAFTLNILQSHGASIDVASRLQEGTTFTITFPVAGAVQPSAEKQAQSAL